jgi:hypothetical protein
MPEHPYSRELEKEGGRAMLLLQNLCKLRLAAITYVGAGNKGEDS